MHTRVAPPSWLEYSGARTSSKANREIAPVNSALFTCFKANRLSAIRLQLERSISLRFSFLHPFHCNTCCLKMFFFPISFSNVPQEKEKRYKRRPGDHFGTGSNLFVYRCPNPSISKSAQCLRRSTPCVPWLVSIINTFLIIGNHSFVSLSVVFLLLAYVGSEQIEKG